MSTPKKRYVPIDVYVSSRPFGVKLEEKWGMEGLCAWMLLLAAAKREPVQGTFTYASEPEAWTKLGAQASAFTFDEFITFCGRNKQTKKTRSGRLTYVDLTGWKRWNDEWRTQQNSEQKSRKRDGSTPDTLRTDSGHLADTVGTEVEVEVESEYESESRPLAAGSRLVDMHREFALRELGTERLPAYKTLLCKIAGADPGTPKVVIGYCKKLPKERIDEVCATLRQGVTPGIAVNALKQAARAYTAELVA